MKICELDEHCGNCELIDYCANPYETPQICMIEALYDIEDTEYKKIADNVTEEEITKKLAQYKADNFMPWDDNMRGAICEIVCEKLGVSV